MLKWKANIAEATYLECLWPPEEGRLVDDLCDPQYKLSLNIFRGTPTLAQWKNAHFISESVLIQTFTRKFIS